MSSLMSAGSSKDKGKGKGKGKEKDKSSDKDANRPKIIKTDDSFIATYPAGALSVVKNMFNKPEFSDLTLCTELGDQKFHVHRGLLCGWSEVFNNLFRTDEGKPSQREVVVGKGSPETWEKVLSYLYTGKVEVNEETVFDMLFLAHQYEIVPLATHCEAYLKKGVNKYNCCSLLDKAYIHNMEKLETKCIDNILKYFDYVSATDAWLQLDDVVVSHILKQDNLRTKSEHNVLLATLKWIEHDESRKKFLDSMLHLVRFPTMSPEDLAHLEFPPYAEEAFKRYQLEGFKYNAEPTSVRPPKEEDPEDEGAADGDEGEEKEDEDLLDPEARRFRMRMGEFTAKKVFGVTNKIETFNIAHSGLYRFTLKGAKAADGDHKTGGRGAIITATYKLKKGSKLELLVGAMSTKSSSGDTGGGGGTFISIDGRSCPLLVAGGGGGTRGATSDADGKDASLEENGLDGQGGTFASGGTGGQGGATATSSYGGGGGGYFGDGTGKAFVNGGSAGLNGGFGGGGAKGGNGGGGGGGYSGGGGGQGAGGGGSYVKPGALDVKKEVGHTGDGEIAIEYMD